MNNNKYNFLIMYKIEMYLNLHTNLNEIYFSSNSKHVSKDD